MHEAINSKLDPCLRSATVAGCLSSFSVVLLTLGLNTWGCLLVTGTCLIFAHVITDWRLANLRWGVSFFRREGGYKSQINVWQAIIVRATESQKTVVKWHLRLEF